MTPENIADALVKISDGDGLQYSDFDYHIRSAIDWQSVESQPGAGTSGASAGDGWDAALNDQSASDMLEVNFQADGAGILSTNAGE